MKVRIWDNDMPIYIRDLEAGEGAGEVDFRVELGEPAVRPMSVEVATVDGTATSHGVVTATDFGKDFEAKVLTLNFVPGQTENLFTVTLIQDHYDEAAEKFTVELRNPVGSQFEDGVATGRILDDDEYLKARLVPSATRRILENAGHPVRFAVDLGHETTVASERSVQVEWRVASGTATLGEDYVESGGVLVIPASHTNRDFEVNGDFEVELVDDSLFEAKTENFAVTLLDRTSETEPTKIRRVEVHPAHQSTLIHIRDEDEIGIAIFAVID